MAQIVVRNIDEATKAALRRRAVLHGHSMEEEARCILRAAVAGGEPPRKLGAWMAGLFTGVGLAEEVAEHRGEPVRPAGFES